MRPSPLTPEKPEDPFKDQLEWLKHRYDPGHYLGGTIAPQLRLSLGRRAKRAAAVLAFLSGLGGLALGALYAAEAGWSVPWELALGPLSLLAGLKLWMSSRAEAPVPGFDAEPDVEGEK